MITVSPPVIVAIEKSIYTFLKGKDGILGAESSRDGYVSHAYLLTWFVLLKKGVLIYFNNEGIQGAVCADSNSTIGKQISSPVIVLKCIPTGALVYYKFTSIFLFLIGRIFDNGYVYA